MTIEKELYVTALFFWEKTKWGGINYKTPLNLKRRFPLEFVAFISLR